LICWTRRVLLFQIGACCKREQRDSNLVHMRWYIAFCTHWLGIIKNDTRNKYSLGQSH
jgi:hypothetical protein